MLFVCMGKFKAASTTKLRVARRVGWKYPAGMRVVAEYWLETSDPALPGLIVIAEADDLTPMMRAIADWDDLMDLTVVPALTAEQGLEFAKNLAA